MLIIVRKAGGHLGGVGICGVIAAGYWWKRMEYGPVGREETAQVYLSKGDSSPEFDTNEKQIREGWGRGAQADKSEFESLKCCGRDKGSFEIREGVELAQRSRNLPVDHTSLASTLL